MMNNASGQTGSSANNGILITFIGLYCHQMYKEPSAEKRKALFIENGGRSNINELYHRFDKRQQAGWGGKGRLTAFSFSACASKPSNCGLAGRPFSSPFRSLESLPEANRVPAKADDDALLSVRRGG